MEMTKFEIWSLVLAGIELVFTVIGIALAIWIGTIAIWGDRWRHRRNLPQLRVRLRNESTFLEPINGVDTRYIHLVVTNSAPWAPAHNVLVFLTQIDRLVDGRWETVYETGPIPLKWQFAGLRWRNTDNQYGIGGLEVGPERICDLGFFSDESALSIFRLTTALDVAKIAEIEDLLRSTPLRFHVYAEGDNARSDTLRVKVTWDGECGPDDHKMAEHLQIETDNST